MSRSRMDNPRRRPDRIGRHRAIITTLFSTLLPDYYERLEDRFHTLSIINLIPNPRNYK